MRKQSPKPKRGKELSIDLLKAAKANSRLEEIKLHGKLLNHYHIERSKKVYTRKQKHRKKHVF